MANQVSSNFTLRFQADGSSSSISWNLKDDPIGSTVFGNNFDLAKNLPVGFANLSTSAGTGTGALSGSNFTITYSAPPTAGTYTASVDFLF